jgi:aryl sulfotransferase
VKNIVWLASYPKSGNTWARVFLTNLLRDSDCPADINQLEMTPIASNRSVFDDVVGMKAADLSYDEVDRLRPEVYRFLSNEARRTCFLKIHDAYTLVDGVAPLVPLESTRSVIYIIRNPLDVVISFANHLGTPIDRAVKRMADENFCFSGNPRRLNGQLRQRLLSWSGHVQSWTDAKDLEVLVIKFEDMKRTPLEIFTRAVSFAGLEKSHEQIKKALVFSDFNEMQRQEKENGFKEKPLKAEAFFRKGEGGAWRNVLTYSQVKKIIKKHSQVMKRFGYLDKKGEPIF